MDPEVCTDIIHYLSVFRSTYHITERARVVRENDTFGRGNELITEAGHSIGYGERRTDLVSNAGLVEGSASIRLCHSYPIRATYSCPTAFIGNRFARTDLLFHQCSITTSLARRDLFYSTGHPIDTRKGERSAVLLIPLAYFTHTSRSFKSAGLYLAVPCGDNCMVPAGIVWIESGWQG